MPQPPAFSFYVQDYLTGTMALSPAERGAYIDCLCYQWEVGGVPGADLRRLARVMRCTPTEAKKLWPAVGAKFVRGDNGLYLNARLELEREGKKRFHAAQARKGARGGRPTSQTKPPGFQKANPNESQTKPAGFQNTKPNESLTFTSSSSSSSTTPSQNYGVVRVAAGAPGLILSPAEFARLRKTHRHVGARLRVPNVLHAELVTKLGGDNPDAALAAWYDRLDAEVEQSREPIPDVFAWLRPKFVLWAGEKSTAAEMAKWAPGGEFDQQIAGKA